jgi:predicted TIM-barrel fold metal-dependent hydrolase
MLLPKFQVSNMESSRPDLIIPGFWTEIAGWPLLDEMIALLDYYPQVYVDTGAIDWLVPRKEFHAYLRRLVEAGDGRRIMFGSNNMAWPESIRLAVESIESADFLTPEQKRDIFYNNAVRFFRLKLKTRISFSAALAAAALSPR